MSNILYKLYQSALKYPELWYMEKLTVNDTKRHDGTPVFSEEDIEYERKSGMPEEMIQQEYYCDFTVSNVGAYYGSRCDKLLKEKRFIDFEVDPLLPTFVGWDLGHGDPMAIIIAQLCGREIRLCGMKEEAYQDLYVFIKHLRDFKKDNNIRSIQNFYPHDIKVHELISGSRYEYMCEQGFGSGDPQIDIISEPLYSRGLMDGINAVRSLFDRFIIHKTHCKYLLECVQNYTKGYNSINKSYNNMPTHDWSSHTCDALRYLCVGIKYYESYGNHSIQVRKNDY